MAGRLQLRRFFYLDASLLHEFLSQLEGGLLEQSTDAETVNRERNVRGGIGVPGTGFGVGGSGGKSTQTGTTRVFGQTPESAFARFYALLDETDEIQSLDAFDDATWQQLKPGEALEVAASLELPQLFAEIKRSDTRREILERMRQFADDDDDDLDEDEVRDAAMTAELAKRLFPRVALSGRAANNPGYGFVVPLRDDALRVPVTDDELLGPVTLFATLTRLVPAGRDWKVTELADRSLFDDDDFPFDEEDFDDWVVPGPAALLNPVAIYA